MVQLSRPHLTPLAAAPNWERLEAFQETMTAQEFEALLRDLYLKNPESDLSKWVHIELGYAEIYRSKLSVLPPLKLRFLSPTPEEPYRRPPDSLESQLETDAQHSTPQPSTNHLPLAGLRIAIDPGHLGGPFAQMEERWFRIRNSPPVMEGEITLKVATKLGAKLHQKGATVHLVRENSNPQTPLRPQDLRKVAKSHLKNKGELRGLDRHSKQKITQESEKLFYRTAEIRARAKKMNDFHPDLVICLHLNAEPWGNPENPNLVPINHLHVLINGAYGSDELEYDDVRFELFFRLLSRFHEKEKLWAAPISIKMGERMRLPPPEVPGGEVIKINSSPYLWARNLLANRLYEAPVVYLEPYVMNNETVFDRIQAGDYDGFQSIKGGLAVENIFEEYASAVTEGLLEAIWRFPDLNRR